MKVWRIVSAATLLSSLIFIGLTSRAATTPTSEKANAVDTGKYKIDGVHSTVIFRVKHMGVSYTYGRFNTIQGAFTMDEKDPTKSSVDILISAESIDTGSPKRDQHLKSPDFFNAKQFSNITFKSTGIKKNGEKYDVTGDLTLHGVTKSITVTLDHVGMASDPRGGTRTGFEGTFTVKRSDFEMKNMLDAIGDDVRVTVSFEAMK